MGVQSRDVLEEGQASKVFVKDIMSSPVVTANEKDSIKTLAKKMFAYDVDSIVIVNEDNEPLGIVTEGDIVRRLLSKKRNLWFTKAKHVMSKPALTVSPEAELEDVAKYMSSKKVKRLCVVNDDNKLIGIITQTDILENANYLIGLLKEMLEVGYSEK